MKALTVCNPWAWAIMFGPKRIENRTWVTRHRGPLLIHAGLSRQWLGSEGDLLPGLPPLDQLVYGAILGTVDVVDCRPLAECSSNDPFASGPWCWVLENPRAFAHPIACRGSLNIWKVPAALASSVEAMSLT